MPTVVRIFGLRVVIYPNDHRPAHVHVIGNGCEAVFNLHCPKGPPEVRENYGFSRKDLAMIAGELTANLAGLCRDWGKIHEHY
jgi:Fe2+ or Zn2+ uptake regulation protein